MSTSSDGRNGELIAARYLQSLGYELLESNWRYYRYEIDLIMRDGNVNVFVEVKTRSTNIFGEPEASVNIRKQRRLIAAAHAYLSMNEIATESRFDVVSIVLTNGQPLIKHLPGAFRPLVK